MKRIFGLTAATDRESGQTLVLVALSMLVLVGFLGLAIDVGNLRAAERRLQETADAAALAGALEINYCSYTSGTACTIMTNASTGAVTENGFASPALTTDTCTTPAVTASKPMLLVNWGPCLLGSTDPNNNSPVVVEAQVGQVYGTTFASVLGLPTVTLTARAEAGRGNAGNCMYVDTKDDGTTGTGTLDIESGGQITLSCGVQDDGQLTSKNGSHLTATQFGVSASSGGGSNQFNPAPSFNTPQVPDPVCATYTYESAKNHTSACGTITYASPAPSAGGSSSSGSAPSGCTVLSGAVSVGSLSPGCYSASSTSCSTGKSKTANGVCDAVQLSGAGTLASGTYIFNGNFDVGGYDVASATGGVTLYFMNGSILNAGGSNINIAAPTSGSMEGMLIWMDPANPTTFPLASGSKSTWDGIIFDEYGTIDMGDGSNATSSCSGNYTIMDAANITASHGGKLNFNLCDDFSTLAGGDPIKGYTAVLSE